MVLILNYLPLLIIAASIAAFWKWRKWWIVLVGAAALFVYGAAQPSYIPKGEVKRQTIEKFTPSTKAEIEDRNRKSVESETRNSEQSKAYKDGLPWSVK